MKYANSSKIFYIIFLFIFCAGGYFLGIYTVSKTTPFFSDSGFARLREDGSLVKTLTSETKGGAGIIFLFLDSDDNIINTFSVEGFNSDAAPSYRFVKGNNRDWLVVNTLTWGTGIRTTFEDWYLITPWNGSIQNVLSYISVKNIYFPFESSEEMNSEVIIENNNDNALDIKFTTKTCTEEKVCKTSSKTDHYVWKINKEYESKSGFVLEK